MLVNRAELLQTLDAVLPGVAQKETVQQSACFVFGGGLIQSFNGEMGVYKPHPLGTEITGAVNAAPLHSLLSKMTEDEVEITETPSELRVKGKGRTSGVRMENEVLLPVGDIPRPDNWKTLPADFCEAIQIVGQCCSNQTDKFVLCCVHLHPEYLEACDNVQAARYPITGFDLDGERLIRYSSAKCLPDLGVTEFCQTGNWLHFRNSLGVVVAVTTHIEDYPEIDRVFDSTGATAATLPAGLVEAVDKTMIFASEADQKVLIELRPGKMRIRGESAIGWFQEVKVTSYNGPGICFMIAPKLLETVLSRSPDCQIGANKLFVMGGKYTFVSMTTPPPTGLVA